jgi:photosystem II stability/assembly factor-like uncharacterized protein
MAKIRLLHTACTLALFAATPVLAQTTAPSAQVTPPTTDAPTPNAPTAAAPMHMHHHGASHMHRMHMGKTDTSQNAAVDQLNDQSFQAAQQGQSVGAASAPMTPAAPAPSGTGKM